MRKYVAIGLLFLAIIGCDFNATDIQIIDIGYYPENNKNVKLAEELIYYDPQYIASKVPAYNENTSKGIKLGYFVRSSDGKPSYRVTYSLKNPSVASNLAELKKQFSEFIPKLVAIHASKEPIFAELQPTGKIWVESLFSDSANALFDKSSSVFQKTVSREQLTTISSQLLKEYGKPIGIEFVRAQYYESFGENPEQVSLFYSARFNNQKKLMIRISTHQQKQQWLIMGFNLEKMST